MLTYSQDLRANIISISSIGDVVIHFSKNIYLPSNYQSFDNNVLTVSVIAGEDSDPNHLNFTWEVTKMNTENIYITLFFVHPEYISYYDLVL